MLPIISKQKNFCIHHKFSSYNLRAKNETINTKMIAPINEGTIAIPPITGPHDPNTACPIAEPTSPAMTLAMIPIEEPLFVIAPAIAPITPPTINDQIKPICISSYSV